MNKRYSIDEKIKIGQETFYRLIETEYGENVKEEMMKKYGIDANNQESIDKAAAAIDALK